MLYFLIGLVSIAICVLNGIQYGWFTSNKDSQLHQIINLWLKDPIEKVALVNSNQDCPQGLKEEILSFHYEGTGGLCVCYMKPKDDSNDRYLYQKYDPTKNLQDCSTIYCGDDMSIVHKVDPIPSANLKIFFISQNNEKQKLCLSRIEGYSFAYKAPEERQCSSDEKYCSWSDKESNQFDIDHGYCIPSNRECYNKGVQLREYNSNYLLQLPLVSFDFLEYNGGQNNIIPVFNTTLKQILDLNNIQYSKDNGSLQDQDYYFLAQHMPRVKVRCRSSLKNKLQNYVTPEGAILISLALIIISVILAFFSFFYFGIVDFRDLTKQCGKNSTLTAYCQTKRINSKFPLQKNMIFVMRPLFYLAQIILNSILVEGYIQIMLELRFMVEDKCVDQYLEQLIISNSYSPGNSLNPFDPSLTIASLALSCLSLLLDQNLYYLLKIFCQFIFCQSKNHCQKENKIKDFCKIEISQKDPQRPSQILPQLSILKQHIQSKNPYFQKIYTDSSIQTDPIIGFQNIFDETKSQKQRLDNAKIKIRFQHKISTKIRDRVRQHNFEINRRILQKRKRQVLKNKRIIQSKEKTQYVLFNPSFKKSEIQLGEKENFIKKNKQSICYNKSKTGETMQPPEAPAPPEQSEQNNTSFSYNLEDEF